MRYFGCKSCWRVYSEEQLLSPDSGGCKCESITFREINNPTSVLLQRLLTDYKYVIKTWIREKLSRVK